MPIYSLHPNTACYKEPGEAHSSISKFGGSERIEQGGGFWGALEAVDLGKLGTPWCGEQNTLFGVRRPGHAVSSAPCYLYDSGFELSAPQFVHLRCDCLYPSPSVALRRYWIGNCMQTARHGERRGFYCNSLLLGFQRTFAAFLLLIV